MRKLVTLRQIDAIEPIPDADAIEVAIIDGWKVVVKKEQFRVGEIVFYLEIDSWVPTTLAPFLSKDKEPREYNGVKGERLKTVKLRGQVSQGLIIPVNEWNNASLSFGTMPEGCPVEFTFDTNNNCCIHLNAAMSMDDSLAAANNAFSQENDESEPVQVLASVLGIQKWEPPIDNSTGPGARLGGATKGNFPHWIKKTDQERAQNFKREIFERNVNTRYEISTKLDGSSMTAYYRDGVVGVCSRNLDLRVEEDSGNAFVRMFIDSGLRDALISLGRNVAVQGELMGEGIQKNREGFKGHKFFIFDVQEEIPGNYLSPHARMEFVKQLKAAGVNDLVDHVPVDNEGKTLAELGITNIEQLIAFADGPSLNNKIREGLVFKSMDGTFSWKIISNKYLLKTEG